MDIRPILSTELMVGDYVHATAIGGALALEPENYRRVEKIEYIDLDAASRIFQSHHFTNGSKIHRPVVLWLHEILGALLPAVGDLHIWLDVPEERRRSDEASPSWGPWVEKENLFAFSRPPNEEEVRLAHRWRWKILNEQ